MTSTTLKFLTLPAGLVLAASMLSTASHAQQVYRIVGPDGKITFSDQPPPAASNAKVTAGSSESARAASNASLPFELRKVVGQYPVTLYTGENCVPCGSARSLLAARGIPFSEKTVSSNDDIQALQRLSGDSSLPFLTIGGQQLKGFSDSEWTQFLDAAGYPKTSALPPNYRREPATPLVAVAAQPAPAERPAARPAAAAPAAPAPAAQNPAGIRF
ncbi:MAG TPA: glutaredoxin family protein [Polaromonas sp.]|uniref:glutaredoxin family protein n=1 Tax=Polaromonas sp. TaxID=1869339 RepID=UPI002D3C910A|nr:glutaredoxin family protein [Polaromonas sp.]HYW58810.1 glutaredoxin family protein [Polaromonas sp.]